MRRSDFDITDTVQTTSAGTVGQEVERLFRDLYGEGSGCAIERAFEEMERCYLGDDPAYHPCDTSYHDVQHVLEVALAMARLMDGYECSRGEDAPSLPRELFLLGIVAALFHDFGYLRRRSDHVHRFGAEYTRTHVSRGARVFPERLARVGLGHLASGSAGATVGELLHYTGYERPIEAISVFEPILVRLGHMLGTADIIAQMSDRCYLEKCRDRLYPEFVLGGLARVRRADGRSQVIYASGHDLARKTPAFYRSALHRLDEKFGRAYECAAHHFGGENLYLDGMHRNVEHARRLPDDDDACALRRAPPNTLRPGVATAPENLVNR